MFRPFSQLFRRILSFMDPTTPTTIKFLQSPLEYELSTFRDQIYDVVPNDRDAYSIDSIEWIKEKNLSRNKEHEALAFHLYERPPSSPGMPAPLTLLVERTATKDTSRIRVASSSSASSSDGTSVPARDTVKVLDRPAFENTKRSRSAYALSIDQFDSGTFPLVELCRILGLVSKALPYYSLLEENCFAFAWTALQAALELYPAKSHIIKRTNGGKAGGVGPLGHSETAKQTVIKQYKAERIAIPQPIGPNMVKFLEAEARFKKTLEETRQADAQRFDETRERDLVQALIDSGQSPTDALQLARKTLARERERAARGCGETNTTQSASSPN